MFARLFVTERSVAQTVVVAAVVHVLSSKTAARTANALDVSLIVTASSAAPMVVVGFVVPVTQGSAVPRRACAPRTPRVAASAAAQRPGATVTLRASTLAIAVQISVICAAT